MKKIRISAPQRVNHLSFSRTQVADCICLMSLSHLQSVPVDTHVYQIAVNHYSFAKSTSKTLTPGVYNEIRAFFIEKFGPYAGWAHSILFCADLKKFQTRSPEAKSKGKRRKVSGWPLGGNNVFYAQAILFWKSAVTVFEQVYLSLHQMTRVRN